MANTKRPPLTRKTTPASERARKEELDEGVSISVNGKTYTLLVGDLTALDAKALRQELGLSVNGMMQALRDDPDIDLVAGIVWLARRTQGERMLKYEHVAEEIGYDADIDAVEPDVVEGEVVDGPEA